MKVFLWSCFIIGLVFLSLRFWIWWGGRKVKWINPQNWIIFPQGEDSTSRRFLKLDGTHNFRDIGGYLTHDGRRVRWGKIYRSDELNELSATAQKRFSDFGIRSVYDLRTIKEREKKPNQLPNSFVSQYHIPAYESQPRWAFIKGIFFQRHTLGDMMADSYISGFENGKDIYAHVLSQFADPENLPALYHCVAGKDRTGILTALLLKLLGVPKETIIADYSLSNLGFDLYLDEFVMESKLPRLGVPNEQVRVLFMVNPDWMRGLLDYIQTEYGSVENALIQGTEMSEVALQKIRENLLS